MICVREFIAKARKTMCRAVFSRSWFGFEKIDRRSAVESRMFDDVVKAWIIAQRIEKGFDL